MQIIHHNPDTLYKNPAFSQMVQVDSPNKLVYVGGQNGVDADGKMADGIAAQLELALNNILEALKVVEATQQNVVKLNIYLVQGQDIREAFGGAEKVWGKHPTAITGVFVAALAQPGALVEIDAVAAVE